MPLTGATVYWAGSVVGTTTLPDGSFELPALPDQKSGLLVARYVGYCADTLKVDFGIPSNPLFILREEVLEEVLVSARKTGATLSRMETLTTVQISGAELCKAACCNLSESFETNASVDVNYSDATTGARQIQLLGLSGRYVQMMTENIPNFRGVASAYGLSYVPGTWMGSIQLSKGVGTVLNGPEALTGQINVAYLDAQQPEYLVANVFANHKGRVETNLVNHIRFNPQWSTSWFGHFSNDGQVNDDNGDGFRDEPNTRQWNLMNKWNHQGANGWNLQGGFRIIDEQRTGGSVHAPVGEKYVVGIQTRRVETWAKSGWQLAAPSTSLGVTASYVWHRQESDYGLNFYNGQQQSVYANVVFQSILGTERHQYHVGASVQGDLYKEHALWNQIAGGQLAVGTQNDWTGGLFYQYTYQIPQKLTIMAGLRADWYNHYRAVLTPRVHIRYSPLKNTTLRLAAGRGVRSASLMAENNYLLASSRVWTAQSLYYREDGWNMGLNVAQYVPLWGKELFLNAEYFYTRFVRQMVADWDNSPGKLRFYALDGKSFAQNVQFEAKYPVARGLELSGAIRWTDVQQTIDGQLRSRPYVGRYKGLIALSYATPLKKWQVDAGLQLNGGGRVPDTSPNPEPYRRPSRFDAYEVLHVQVTKYFKRWSIYMGSENLTNFTQPNPIVAGNDPFGAYFDGTMIWGPLAGRRIYAGLRMQWSK